jgi:hypothetical protein
MPYKLEPAVVGRGFFVVTKGTGRKHSDKPLPRARAVNQMQALYRAARLQEKLK